MAVNCPTCGWGMQMNEEIEAQGFVVGKYYCRDCPTIVIIKTPLDWMVAKGRWK